MNRNISLIAAAVSAALASGYANAGAVTLAQAAAPDASLVISGSSAAQSGMFAAITADLCGAASTTYKSSGDTSNFLAISCTTGVAIPGTPGLAAGKVITVYYRTEGGSVVGALPIASGNQILRLNLSNASCTDATHTCSVTKGTYTNTLQAAINDGWAVSVVPATTQLGVTDVEPGQLVGLDYPSNYNAAVFGTQASNTAKLPGLTTKKLFQQVFGLVVNTSGETFSTVNLGKAWAAKILDGNVTDWSLVPNVLSATPGAAIASAAAPITRVDREPGSGTRTSANIFFNRLGCGSTTGIVSPTSETLNFSTGDELTLANNTPGSIAYASIDQIQNPANSTKFTNLVLATIDGVAPSNYNAAIGKYDFWFEATLVPNTTANTLSDNISAFLQTDLPAIAKAPSIPDVNAIPNIAGNVKAIPLTTNGKTGTTEIYVNPFTRGATSCNDPS